MLLIRNLTKILLFCITITLVSFGFLFIDIKTANAMSYSSELYDNLDDVNTLVNGGDNGFYYPLLPIDYEITIGDVQYPNALNIRIQAIEMAVNYMVINSHLFISIGSIGLYRLVNGELVEPLDFTFDNSVNVNESGYIDLGPITWYQQYNFTPSELYDYLRSVELKWFLIFQNYQDECYFTLRLQISSAWYEYTAMTFSAIDIEQQHYCISGHSELMPHTNYLYQRYLFYASIYEPELPDISSVSDWLVNAVGGFMDFEIIPGLLSITDIFLFVLSLGLMIVLLRYFAGG